MQSHAILIRVLAVSTLVLTIASPVATVSSSQPQRDASAIADRRIERELLAQTVVVCKDVPLDDLLTTDLANRHEIRFEIDAAALKQVGIEPDTPVTHDLRNITLKGALDIIVGAHGLIWEVRGMRIVITAKKQ